VINPCYLYHQIFIYVKNSEGNEVERGEIKIIP